MNHIQHQLLPNALGDAALVLQRQIFAPRASFYSLAGGDLTGVFPYPTLATSGVSPATYGSATQVAQVTVDAKGRITSASNVTISAGGGTVTNVATGTGLTGGPITTTGTISVDQATTFGWTGVHTWTISSGTDAIELTSFATPLIGNYFDSPMIRFRGKSDNGSAHTTDWVVLNQLTSTAGASYLRWYSRIDTGGYAVRFTLTDAGNGTFDGTVAGSNLSGTNTGDQTITLTGDVTGSGTGSFATTVGSLSVSPSLATLAFAKRPLEVVGPNWSVQKLLGTNPTTTLLTATGSSTYTTPLGAKWLFVRMVGGGGGGGGVSGAASQTAAGAGGGGGAYCETSIPNPSATYTYQCGALGAGGTAGANPGSAGSSTTFSTLTAPGGNGGAGHGTGTAADARVGAAGGAVATNGGVNSGGAPGQTSIRQSGTIAVSGGGGSSPFGGGGKPQGSAGAGDAATGYGAGGGGAMTASAVNRAGGNGSNGVIVVQEFY